MSANFLNTNRNASRFFFATQEDGEQTLGLQYGTTGGAAPISTMAVTISGTQGNGVIVTEAPAYLATEFCLGENAMMGGTNSTYQTLSSINTTLTGFNISMDRVSGSGTTTIENYGTNGSAPGFEFLCRGVGSALQSTLMESYLSTIGRPGATMVLGPGGGLAVRNSISQLQSAPLDTSGNFGTTVQTYPAPKTNVEFGAAGPNNVVPITAVQTNMFSVPLSGLNPNTQTLLNIDFANALSSSASALVSYRVGFSTATAYTNVKQTVPVGGGSWTPSGIPSAATPITWTNICCMLDSDGINPDGTATLYIDAQLANPSATADQIFIKKGLVTEPTRNAIVYRSI